MNHLQIYLENKLGTNDIRFLELLRSLPNNFWGDKQGALAITLGIHPITANALIKRLEKKKFIKVKKFRPSTPLAIWLSDKFKEEAK